MIIEYLEPDGYLIRLHMAHWLPRLVMKIRGGVNLCMTLGPHDVRVGQTWLGPKGLSHEARHCRQADERGWRYLPWVLKSYLTQGYAKSDPETDADRWMLANWKSYPTIGPVPSWVVDK